LLRSLCLAEEAGIDFLQLINYAYLPSIMEQKVCIVTGANSGLGYEVTKVLAGKGFRVILACRNTASAAEAVAKIRSVYPDAACDVLELDLASFDSVRKFAATFLSMNLPLHVLVNNAGVALRNKVPNKVPYLTADGLEPTMGTNHFGHFLLTNLLLPLILRTPGARVVVVASRVHNPKDRAGSRGRPATLDFDNLNGEHSYEGQWFYRKYGFDGLFLSLLLTTRVELTSTSAVRNCATCCSHTSLRGDCAVPGLR
jgi:NAD(P)-dependent dehydrogenase (short-subunit alcohol dehydrogenase family)